MSNKQRNELSKEMQRIMASLDSRWIQAASRELCSNLSALLDSALGRSIARVLAWVPHFPGEVDLSPFIDEQLAQREVYLPRMLENRTLAFIAVGSDWRQQLQPSFMGIPGPRLDAGRLFDPHHAQETAVITPGFAFDAEGNRVGRDLGCYSHFFRSGTGNVIKIGVCWSLQLIPEVPAHPNEVGMDWVCHERAFLRTALQFEEDI